MIKQLIIFIQLGHRANEDIILLGIVVTYFLNAFTSIENLLGKLVRNLVKFKTHKPMLVRSATVLRIKTTSNA